MKKLIQSKRDREVWNMMDYLSEECCSSVTKRSDGIFTGEYLLSSSHIPLLNETIITNSYRENHSFVVDFNKHTIELYAYDESYHNGDHYNCIDYAVKWSHVYSSYDSLKEKVRQKAIVDVEQELQEKRGTARMQQVIDGKWR